MRPIDRSGTREAPRRGRRDGVAVAASVALHGVLVGLVLSVGLAPPARSPDPPLTFEVVAEPAHSPAPPAQVAPPPPEAPPPPRRRRRDRPDPRPEPPSDPAAPPSDPAAPPPDPAARPPGPIALLPTVGQLDRAGVLLEASPGQAPADGAKPPRTGPSRWQRGLAARQRRDAGRAAIAARKAPPEAFDLLRDLEKIYAPSQALVITLAKKHAGRPRDLDRWLGRYLQGFGAKPDTAPGQPFDPSAAFVRSLSRAELESAARVCATFRPGADPAVEVDIGSGIAAFDALAVDAVARGAHRRQGQVPHTRVCYLFSAKLTRIPPLPILACMLTSKGVDCVYPLKEIASTRVTLDGVETADPPP